MHTGPVLRRLRENFFAEEEERDLADRERILKPVDSKARKERDAAAVHRLVAPVANLKDGRPKVGIRLLGFLLS